MNPLVAVALIALLQKEVNLLELQLAQLQANTAIIATTTPLLGVQTSTISYGGILYPDTVNNEATISDLNSENASCTAEEASLQSIAYMKLEPGVYSPKGTMTPAEAKAELATEQTQCDNQTTVLLNTLTK